MFMFYQPTCFEFFSRWRALFSVDKSPSLVVHTYSKKNCTVSWTQSYFIISYASYYFPWKKNRTKSQLYCIFSPQQRLSACGSRPISLWLGHTVIKCMPFWAFYQLLYMDLLPESLHHHNEMELLLLKLGKRWNGGM